MLKSLAGNDVNAIHGFEEFAKDFRRRFLQLLGYGFREFSSLMGLTILEAIASASGRTLVGGSGKDH